MATIITEIPISRPIIQSVPNSIKGQQAVFWSGIYLTTLLLIGTLIQFLSSHQDSVMFATSLVMVPVGYGGYLWLRRFWNTSLDQLNEEETLFQTTLSDLDGHMASSSLKTFQLTGCCVMIALTTAASAGDGRFFLLLLSQAVVMPMYLMMVLCNQEPRLSILPSGLLWRIPNTSYYFPWHSVESARLIPGDLLDRLQWTAPNSKGKPHQYETKLTKLTVSDREKLQNLLSQFTSISVS